MAHKIFRKYPYFLGTDDRDQLQKIVEVLGSEELLRFQLSYRNDISDKFKVG